MITRIPTPHNLLPLTATITPATNTIPSGGWPEQTFASQVITVACNLQPASTREAIQYQRDTGTTTYDFYFSPQDTDGAAVSISQAAWKNARVAIGGVVYRTVGTMIDPITNGCIYRLVLEVDV